MPEPTIQEKVINPNICGHNLLKMITGQACEENITSIFLHTKTTENIINQTIESVHMYSYRYGICKRIRKQK